MAQEDSEYAETVDPHIPLAVYDWRHTTIESIFNQAIGIALESQRFDISSIYSQTEDASGSLLAYTMEGAVLDTAFSLSYRDQIHHFLFPSPLFPRPTAVLDTGFSLSYRDQIYHFLFPSPPLETTLPMSVRSWGFLCQLIQVNLPQLPSSSYWLSEQSLVSSWTKQCSVMYLLVVFSPLITMCYMTFKIFTFKINAS
jgi:hypothetical protein